MIQITVKARKNSGNESVRDKLYEMDEIHS